MLTTLTPVAIMLPTVALAASVPNTDNGGYNIPSNENVGYNVPTQFLNMSWPERIDGKEWKILLGFAQMVKGMGKLVSHNK